MALSASGWKYISSSGATNPLGSGSPASGSWSLRSHSFGECADSRFERCLGRVRGVFIDSSANVLLIFGSLGHWLERGPGAWSVEQQCSVDRLFARRSCIVLREITSRHGVT